MRRPDWVPPHPKAGCQRHRLWLPGGHLVTQFDSSKALAVTGHVGHRCDIAHLWRFAIRSCAGRYPFTLVIPMILTIDSDRRITLPRTFAAGDHVLLFPFGDSGYKLVPAVEATQEELEQAMEDELQNGADGFRDLAKTLRQR